MSKKRLSKSIDLITLTNPTSPIAEQYRTIRTNLQYSTSLNEQLKTLVVTSAGPSEGKSKTASNLAVVFAKSGSKVLLIDADMRKPTLFKKFNLFNTTGLSTVLNSEKSLDSAVKQTDIENLFVLTSGPRPENPSELLDSAKMSQLIEEARDQYDMVIFDLPPIVVVTDAQILASKVDGSLLVVREKVTKKDALVKAYELLNLVGAQVVGAVYNGVHQSSSQTYYY